MINRIDKSYYKEGEVQIMVPNLKPCTIIVGPKGIKFHSDYGNMKINDYLYHPKRTLFPYHTLPTHKDENGEFVNQLFELNKLYLIMYFNGFNFRFRSDYFFQVKDNIYKKTEIEQHFSSQNTTKMPLEQLREKMNETILSSVFFIIIDDKGVLHEYYKNHLDYTMPSSGICLFGNGTDLKIIQYKMELKNNQITIQNQELIFQNNEEYNLENAEKLIEPSINKR